MKLLPRISLNLLRRYHTKKKQQRTFEALVVGLFTPHERHSHLLGMNHRDIRSLQGCGHSSCLQNNSTAESSRWWIRESWIPCLQLSKTFPRFCGFSFEREFISSAWLSFKWSFIATFFYVAVMSQIYEFLMFTQRLTSTGHYLAGGLLDWEKESAKKLKTETNPSHLFADHLNN